MNADMENHKEQRDTGAHKAGKKEKMAQERQKEYVEKSNAR